MVRIPFVPKNFTPPKETSLNDYLLIPITTKDALEDFIVLTNNAEIIHKVRGGGSNLADWPIGYTLEENYKDLAWLENCAQSRQLFSYILRRQENNLYAGCLYIYPIELFFQEKAKDYDVDFSFWITQQEFDKGNYDNLTKDLLGWLIEDWPFKKERILFRNKLIPKNLKD